MRRRIALLLVTAFAVNFSSVSLAQESQQPGQIKPYLQVKPLPGDEKVIRAFFSPNCSFSRMYLPFFKNLSATLPEDKVFMYTPLVNKGDGLTFALGFAAVQRFYPNFVQNFIEAAIVGVQDKGISTVNWAGIDRLGKAARLPVSLPMLVKSNQDMLMQDVEHLIAVRHHLAILNTPAVSVAGTYIVTPEFTGGDVQLFSQLVNGIISMTQ
jgi:hypothetical protein